MSYFTIEPGTDHVPLDAASRAGSVASSVQNKTGAARTIRAMALTDDPAHEHWYTVREPVREARVDEAIRPVAPLDPGQVRRLPAEGPP